MTISQTLKKDFSGSAKRRTPDGFSALYKKELSDHLNSKRFYIIFALLLIVATASLMGSVSSLSGDAAETSATTGFVFLSLFTTGSSSRRCAARSRRTPGA